MTRMHRVDERFAANSRYKVAIIGAGGTGSQMVTCFARLSIALRHLRGKSLEVDVFDADRVSPSNIGRQLYLPGEVGANKAVALVTRANCQFGFDWRAFPCRFEEHPGVIDRSIRYDLVVTCVDTVKARLAIANALSPDLAKAYYVGPTYWIDIGNKTRSGQVWLGEISPSVRVDRLFTVIEAFPEQYDPNAPEDDTPSCSLAQALASQDLFVNDHAARYGIDLAERIFRYGETEIQGWFFDLDTGSNAVYVPRDSGPKPKAVSADGAGDDDTDENDLDDYGGED